MSTTFKTTRTSPRYQEYQARTSSSSCNQASCRQDKLSAKSYKLIKSLLQKPIKNWQEHKTRQVQVNRPQSHRSDKICPRGLKLHLFQKRADTLKHIDQDVKSSQELPRRLSTRPCKSWQLPCSTSSSIVTFVRVHVQATSTKTIVPTSKQVTKFVTRSNKTIPPRDRLNKSK